MSAFDYPENSLPLREDGIQPVAAVDFDGTICDFAYPGIGQPKAGVKEALRMFRELGYKVVIYTCRTSNFHADIFGGGPPMERDRVKEMIAYLAEHEIPYDEVDDGSRGKPMAAFYVDDKAIRFEDNWQKIAAWVYTRRPL